MRGLYDFIIKPIDGFGTPEMLRITLATEKPDILLSLQIQDFLYGFLKWKMKYRDYEQLDKS